MIEESKKFRMMIFLECIFLIGIIIFLLFFFKNKKANRITITNIEVDDMTDIDYKYDVVIADDQYQIVGWFYRLDEQYEYFNYGLDTNTLGVYNNYSLATVLDDAYYVFPTILNEVEKGTVEFKDGIDHRECGFVVYISRAEKEIIDKNGLYIIAKEYDGDEKAYKLH